MVRSVHIRRFVAVLLCCLLAFHYALPVARAAEPVSATLSIAAGALALGGLSAAAVESTIGPQVAAVIGTTMEGLGTSVYIAEDSAMTKTKFIMSKIAVWCYQAGKAKEDFYKTVASGISVAANGTIQLGKNACEQISQFVNWLYSQEGEVVSPDSLSGGTTTKASVGDYDLIYFPAGANSYIYSTLYGTYNSNVFDSVGVKCAYETAIMACSNGIVLLARNPSSSKSCEIRFVYNGAGVASAANSFTSYRKQFSLSGVVLTNHYDITYSDFLTYLNSNPVSFEETTQNAYDEVFTGLPETWEENKDLLNPSGDQVTTLTPDLINSLLARLGTGDWTMDVISYLEALKAAFDELTDEVAKVRSKVTGIEKEIANPTTVTEEVSVVDLLPDPVPVIEPVELTPGGTIEGFSFPLDEIFPFCIPFDVVAALELFDVPAEAPSLHVHWVLPYNIVFDFDLDLSVYDDIAALLRVMETILFAVGLAVATRSLYIRS